MRAGIVAVEQVVPIFLVCHVDVIVFIPSSSPVLRERIQHREPVAAILKSRISVFILERKAINPESVSIAVISLKIVVRNPVAVITASLLPIAVLVLPVVRAPLLPCADLHPLLIKLLFL